MSQLKLPPFLVTTVRNAFGIKSTVPDTFGLVHYLLLESDECNYDSLFRWAVSHFRFEVICYPTPHGGSHAIIFKKGDLRSTLYDMLECPWIDKKWLQLGLRRGYWFLETHVPVFRSDVEYMRIQRCGELDTKHQPGLTRS